MKSSLSLAFLLLLSGAGNSFANAVELNGLACLFGEKTAFLVLDLPAETKPVGFVLSEGESKFGVKLLAIDIVNRRVKIEEFGVTQDLRLCSAPDLAMAGAAAVVARAGGLRAGRLTPQEQLQIGRFLNTNEDFQKIQSGAPLLNPAFLAGPYPGNTKSSDGTPGTSSSGSPANSGSAANSGSSSRSGSSVANGGATDPGTAGVGSSPVGSTGSSATGSDSASGSSTDYTRQYWYLTSLNIEKNRLATANDVIGGDLEPLPRTPLTPAQTPAALVGTDTFFPTHIPGFVYGGTPDSTMDY